MDGLISFLWRWTKRALGATVVVAVGLVIVSSFVDTAPPKTSAGEPLKIMGVPLVRAADDGDAQETWQAEVLQNAAAEPAGKSLEETVAEILSRPDDSDAEEPWPAAAIERHARLRDLYREFLTFRDSAEFRRYGFGRGGRFAAWHERVVDFDGGLPYSALLYDRCELTPDDLRRHARDHMNGKTGPQVRADAAAWAACFPD